MDKGMNCFHKTLCYTSPAHGGWGMVRIGMSVPDSFQIFFSPPACGRHGAISSVLHRYRNRLAYYFLEEKDVVSGGYEKQIFDAVDLVLKRLKKKPRAMLLFVTCIDDLMGTDLEELTLELKDRFQEIDFTFCHMDPIRNDSKLPPPQNIQHQMYALLEKKELKKDTVNCIGNLMPIDEDCELYSILNHMGIKNINHILNCRDYDEFKNMASAYCNLMISPNGAAAVKSMNNTIGIPYEEVAVSYDLDIIQNQYKKLMNTLASNISQKEKQAINTIISYMEEQAVNEVENTKKLIGNIPIYIDSSAVAHPYELAWFLHRKGFLIKGIFAEKPSESEKEAFQNLVTVCSDIQIVLPQHPKTMIRSQDIKDTFSIGFEAAYTTQSRYVLDLFSDEGMFGYYGVIKLMKMMRKCYENPVDLKKLLDSYGLVV